MRIIHRASELQNGARAVCAAIGVFDGVHLGHQRVIRQAGLDAHLLQGRTVVITFDCHPEAVLAPPRAPALIYPLAKKLEVLGALGVEAVLVLHFDRPFSQQPAEAFVRGLARDFGTLRSLSVGNTFTFGHRRRGHVALLELLGQELSFRVHGLEPVLQGGEVISSSRIRTAIQAGQFELANQMLGRSYTLAGRVRAGDRLGRRLGFPTANLQTDNLVLPSQGVYAVRVFLAGQTHPAVLNIGTRPTLEQSQSPLQVEAHLLDFSGDLYGADLEVQFIRHLRAEQKFASPAALQDQIRRDIDAARQVLG